MFRVFLKIGIGTPHAWVFHISALLEIHSKYVLLRLRRALEGLDYSFRGLISLPRAFPLHRKVFSLHSRKVIGIQ